MSVRRQISDSDGIFSITFTCCNWIPLIEIVNGYDIVYKQFDYLKSCGHHIVGYTIMPNHLHAVIAFCNTGKSINSIIGNIKRFMAYDIVERLKQLQREDILLQLKQGVNSTEKKKGQLHKVFETSFDAKHCYDEKMILQKLNYFHNNPCTGKWELADSPLNYIHSSAKYYLTGEQGIYPVTSYRLLQDMDLTVLQKARQQ